MRSTKIITNLLNLDIFMIRLLRFFLCFRSKSEECSDIQHLIIICVFISDFADYYYSVDVQFPLYPDLSLVPLLPLTGWTLFKPNVHITPLHTTPPIL